MTTGTDGPTTAEWTNTLAGTLIWLTRSLDTARRATIYRALAARLTHAADTLDHRKETP